MFTGSLEVLGIAHAAARGVFDEFGISDDMRTELNEDIQRAYLTEQDQETMTSYLRQVLLNNPLVRERPFCRIANGARLVIQQGCTGECNEYQAIGCEWLIV